MTSLPTPPSIKQLAADAEGFEFNVTTPFRYWLRAADAINRQAHIYVRDGDDQNAYIFLLRHAILVLEKLERYPESRNSSELDAARKISQSNIALLEEIKPRIDARYKRFHDILAQHEDLLKKQKAAATPSRPPSTPAAVSSALDSYYESGKKVVDPTKNQQLALSLAYDRIPFQAASESGSEGWIIANNLRKLSVIDPCSHSSTLRSDEGIRPGTVSLPLTPLHSNSPNLSYPTVPGPASTVPVKSRENRDSTSPAKPLFQQHTSSVSSRLPRHHGLARAGTSSSPTPPPPLPSKQPLLQPVPPSGSKVNQESQGSKYTFKITSFSENGNPLRTVFLPPKLQDEFMRIASSNTKRNLETCGILCGKLISNALFISHLVIPDQVSTSNTCDTVNEAALFEYCNSNDLLTIGWIHTHPTQTCFMSSRDLHTHSGYQVQMPESIAIVCAPQHTPSYGIFRLTDPPGLRTVLGCTESGPFHPHTVDNLYKNISHHEHVCLLEGLKFQAVDLRP